MRLKIPTAPYMYDSVSEPLRFIGIVIWVSPKTSNRSCQGEAGRGIEG